MPKVPEVACIASVPCSLDLEHVHLREVRSLSKIFKGRCGEKRSYAAEQETVLEEPEDLVTHAD